MTDDARLLRASLTRDSISSIDIDFGSVWEAGDVCDGDDVERRGSSPVRLGEVKSDTINSLNKTASPAGVYVVWANVVNWKQATRVDSCRNANTSSV